MIFFAGGRILGIARTFFNSVADIIVDQLFKHTLSIATIAGI
jgi:hypothetical protein